MPPPPSSAGQGDHPGDPRNGAGDHAEGEAAAAAAAVARDPGADAHQKH